MGQSSVQLLKGSHIYPQERCSELKMANDRLAQHVSVQKQKAEEEKKTLQVCLAQSRETLIDFLLQDTVAEKARKLQTLSDIEVFLMVFIILGSY